MKGRVSKINQVKGYVSKVDQLQLLRIAFDRFFKLTSSFPRLLEQAFLLDRFLTIYRLAMPFGNRKKYFR